MSRGSVTLPDGTNVPALGQGTWHMGEDSFRQANEVRALRQGIDLGLTLIDTAEMYGDGGAEKVVGEAIMGRRDEVFLVSKVLPQHANSERMSQACDASLRRLGTDSIDLYLLHWSSWMRPAETIAAFESLRHAGKIRRWGVSNLDIAAMQRWSALTGGDACCADQVLYHLGARGIENDLLPWCREHSIPMMAYCPLAQGQTLLEHPALIQIAADAGATPAQVMLAWAMRGGDIIAIPKAADPEHLADNAGAAELTLDDATLAALDAAFPAPEDKQPLAII